MPSPALSAAGLPPGTFDVDAAGQATYRIPIVVAPGLGGAQPELAFTYGSRSRDGLLGVGWALAGLPVITRTKATYAIDGYNGQVDYGPGDRFALDGQRLINMAGEYGGPNTLYYTELQSWSQVRAGAAPEDGFTVVTRSGEVQEFGRTADSLIRVPGGTAVRVWALSATIDRHGNRVEYSYDLGTDPGEGAYYPAAIRYTVRGDMPAARQVSFTYEPRPDPISGFAGGHPIYLAQRLAGVKVTFEGEPVREYRLTYRTSETTRLSCLESIVESGADGASLPATTMSWSEVAGPGFAISPPSLLDQHLGTPDILPMNVAGGGRTDLVQIWTGQDGQLHATTYLATPGEGSGKGSAEGSAEDVRYQRGGDTLLGSFGTRHRILPADLDGDGRSDLLIAYASGPRSELKIAVFLSNGCGFVDGGTFATGDTWSPSHIDFFAMDANGDGRTDLVEAYAHQGGARAEELHFRTYLSFYGDGEKTFGQAIVSPTGDPAHPDGVLGFWPMDVNGDGAVDLVRVRRRGPSSGVIVEAYLAFSKSLDHSTFAPAVLSDLGGLALANQSAFFPVDVNADGIPDLVQVWSEASATGTQLHLTTFFGNAAGHFAAGPDSVFENTVLNDFYLLDLDGGGSPSLVGQWISGADRLMFTAFRSSPAGIFRQAAPFDAGGAGSTVASAVFVVGDANGDGKGDLIRLRPSDTEQIQVVPYLSSGALPDLLTGITNPLGGAVAITYAPLSDPAVYQVDAPAGAAGSYPGAGPLRQPAPIAPTQLPAEKVLGQALYVVASYEEKSDPRRNRFSYSSVTSMTYAGGRIDLLGRGWQGFATITQTAARSGRSIRRSFLQDFPRTFQLARQEVLEGGQPRSSSSTVFRDFERGQGVAGTRIYEVLPVATLEEQFDGASGELDFALGQTFRYDEFGSPIDRVWLGYLDAEGHPREPAEVVHHYAAYRNEIRSDGWALGFLRYAKDSANAVDADISKFLAGDYRLEQRTYTAENEIATRQNWDDVNQVWLSVASAYDVYGNPIAETQPGGATTTTEYDPKLHSFPMRRISPPDAQGRTLATCYAFDPRFGLEAARQDPNLAITLTGYDAFGRKAWVQGPVPAGTRGDQNAVTPLLTGSPELRARFQSAAGVVVETWSYRDDGAGGIYAEKALLQSFPTGAGRDFVWNRSYFDGRARQRQALRETGQSAGNAAVLTDYDDTGNATLVTAPFFSPPAAVAATPLATRTTYDVLDRPLTRITPNGPDGQGCSSTTWLYESGGRVTVTAAAASASPYVQLSEQHHYDGEVRVRAITVDPRGAKARTTFSYDALGRLIGTREPATPSCPAGIANTVVWDSLDRHSSLDDPDQNTTGNSGIAALSFAYDRATGRLAARRDAAGATLFFSYDALGRVVGKQLPDGRAVSFTYDDPAAGGGGRLTGAAVTAAGISESRYDFGYDAYGNAAEVALTIHGEAAAFLTRASFDPQRRRVAQTLPDGGRISHTYAFGQLVAVANGVAKVAYPLEAMIPSEKPSRLVFGDDSVTTRYDFSPLGQIFRERVGTQHGTVIDASYSYDPLEQLLSSGGDSFAYRGSRLARATVEPFGAAAYVYDDSGNLIAKDGVDYEYRAHYPVSGTAGGKNVFAATYDACGRTATRLAGGRRLGFEYDGRGCLESVSDEAGNKVRQFSYDAFGNGIRQSDDRRVVLYVNAGFTLERPAAGPETARRSAFDPRGVVAEVAASGGEEKIRYFRRDPKGSSTHGFDAAGTVVLETAFAGYGLPRALKGDGRGEPGYEQRQWDDELGLLYFGARYYDPVTGRFLTPDSEIGARSYLQPDALNRFAFELNNPVNQIDPTGHGTWNVVGGVIAGLALVMVGGGLILAGLAAGTCAAIGTGALIGAGLSAMAFSAGHTQTEGGRFWGGWAANLGVGALLGGVTGGLSAGVVAPLATARTNAYLRTVLVNQVASKKRIFGIRAAVYGISGAAMGAAGGSLSQIAGNSIERSILGRNIRPYAGVGRSAAIGAVVGAVAGALQAGVEAYNIQIDENLLGVELQPLFHQPQNPEQAFELAETFRLRTVLFTVSTAADVSGSIFDSEA